MIIRTSDEVCIKHLWHSTKFLSSYHMMKIFEIILTKDLNLWRGNINQYNTAVLVNGIQFNNCIQVQSYVYTSSKKFQSSFTINTSLKKFKNIFKVQFKSTELKKISKNFKKFSKPEWKNFKNIFNVLNAWLWNVRIFLKYSKSKQEMDTKYGWKNFKVQIQNQWMQTKNSKKI